MNLQQDYSLYTDTQRVEAVNALLTRPDSTINTILRTTDWDLCQRPLEQLANYILFGKDPNKLTNSVQRKEINSPTTRHATYRDKHHESLDEMMEQPGFDQRQLDQRNNYTHPKPTINNKYQLATQPAAQPTAHPCPLSGTCARCTETCYLMRADCDGAIPGMAQLWDSIKHFQHLLALAQHRIAPNPALPEEQSAYHWDTLKQYRIKHWLIDLRKHQYYLKDTYKPIIPSALSSTAPGAIDWDSDAGYYKPIPSEEVNQYPEELTHQGPGGQWVTWHTVRSHTLDLTNPQHIYHLLLLYDELWKDSWDRVDGQMKWILDALDEIGRRTDLAPAQNTILQLRVLKWTNQRISDQVLRRHGLRYNPNYLSIIFKRNICGKLASTAALMQREYIASNQPEKWKCCSCCGRRLLVDDANFVKKNGTHDGYSARCKKCDAEKRREAAEREAEDHGQ